MRTRLPRLSVLLLVLLMLSATAMADDGNRVGATGHR